MHCLVKCFLILLMCAFKHANAQPEKVFSLLSAAETGISFQNSIKETEELNVLSYEYLYNGGGVAAGDINNDGLIDLYFTSNMESDKLYLNKGNLRFEDISKQAQLKSKDGWKTGVTMADVNADGWLDIYICYSGSGDAEGRKNKLFINNKNLTFTEKAKEFGLDDFGYSTHAAFFDYDRDGDLDMYLLNHGIKDYKEIEAKYLKTQYDSLAADKLYRNDASHFTDVSAQAGISGNPISYGLGLSISDVNMDGWPDIYVSNDYQEHDYLYINQRDGTFSEKSHSSLQHISNFSMGNDIADFNNDGLPDIITLDMLPEDNRRQKLLKDQENYELFNSLVVNGFHYQYMRNMLHLNNGNGTFTEMGQLAGISNTDWSWASLFADFDNDGFKDLFITNGYLRDYTNKDFLKYWGRYLVEKATKMEKTMLMDIVKAMPSTKNKNYLFKNNGDLSFSNKSDEWGLDQLVLSNGAVYADLDNDGDLEIITNNVNERAYIFKNNSVESVANNYLAIKLEGNTGNQDAVGAKVFLYTAGHLQMAEQNPSRGFQSSVSHILHFGLGSIKAVDSMIIHWPEGHVQKLYDIAANQTLKTNSDINSTQKFPIVIAKKTFFTTDTSLIDFAHRDYDYNDFKRQPMMPFMFSYTSPILVKGDVNKDGLEDLFVGTSKGQQAKIFLQRTGGKFEDYPVYKFYEDRMYTTTDAQFFDADGDGDQDLYCVSGTYHDYDAGNVLLNDRIYFNDGEGNFTERSFIQNTQCGKSTVAATDFDNDGDIDVFVGGLVVPGKFPENPRSFLLENDGKGNFTDVTSKIATPLVNGGMIKDAAWLDINNDNLPDLITAGYWMPIRVFINNNKQVFEDRTSQYFEKEYSGFWNTLAIHDIDNDGDNDILAGNLGTNSQIRASTDEPAELLYSDFDNNGSLDPFFCYYTQGISYPDASRDLLLDQMYGMRKKFVNYASYADATLANILEQSMLAMAKRYQVNHLETSLFINENGKFVISRLPIQAQFSPATRFEVTDLNNDKMKDLIILGNFSNARIKYGKMDSNFGTILLNNGNGFSYTTPTQSGLVIRGDVKGSALFETDELKILVVGINKGKLVVERFNK